QVSWLTSLLHADILSSRFHQQANSPGSWTKLALKPLLLKRIQNASLETCVSWQTSLLHADILTNSPGSWAKLALNHPLLHKRIQNASWESCGCGAGVLSLGILGSTGCRSLTQGPAAKSQVFKLRWLQRLGCERCHLGQQRRSEGDVGEQKPTHSHNCCYLDFYCALFSVLQILCFTVLEVGPRWR
ncbi:Holin-like protein CidA, partial [Frankliniella fusca]